MLVVVADARRLTLDFDHDLSRAVLLGEEAGRGTVQDLLDPRPPHCLLCPRRPVVQRCRSDEHRAEVVGPVIMRHRGTVVVGVRVVPDLVLTVLQGHQGRCSHPVPSFARPVGIRLVVRVACQPRRQLEIPTIGYGVLQVPSGVERIDLPTHPTAACAGVPVTRLKVKDRLGEFQPRRLSGWRGGKVGFSSVHGRKGPKCLVVYTHVLRLIRRVVVLIWSDLELQRLRHGRIVAVITSILPIIDQTSKHGTSFPPVITSA